MLTTNKSDGTNNQLILDPIVLLTQELKDKNLKKQALEQIATIAIVLSPIRIREQLVPLLIKTFTAENIEIRLVIIKSFSILLQFLQTNNNSFVLLQFILDVLCVFSEEEIRRQAYIVLQKIMQNLNLRVYQGELIKVIKQLSKQNEKNIRELVLKIIRYIYIVAQNQNQQYLIQLLGQYKAEESDQLLLAQQICQFIKIMPPFPESQIHNIMNHLLKSPSAKVRAKLIEPVILLTKVIDDESTTQYFQMLLKDTSSEVTASLILQISKIMQLQNDKFLNKVLQVIDAPQNHDSTIRAAILQILQHIPLTQSRRAYTLSSNHFKSLSLSKALADSLCKIHDIEAISYLIDNSDTQFKNKLFPKLPSACQIHIKLMDHIFNQKNWRSKLTLLQNIEKRMENQENVEIFIPKLLQQLGDKIGVLRASVVRIISLIMKTRKIQLKQISKQLNQSFSSKNWFQRQTVLLLMQELAPTYSSLTPQDKAIFKSFIVQGNSSSIHNIKLLTQQIKSTCKIND